MVNLILFFGMKHTQSSKDAMSKSKGTLTFIYSIDLDFVLTPIGCYTSSNCFEKPRYNHFTSYFSEIHGTF